MGNGRPVHSARCAPLKVRRDFEEATVVRVPPSARVHFAAELTDMRKGIDGLRARIEGH